MADGSRAGRPEPLASFAKDLFYEHGYDATSMQDLAEAAGLQKSSLYHYVRGKDELLRHIVETSMASLMDELDGAERSPGTPGERLRLAFRGAIDCALGDIKGMSLVLSQKPGTPIGAEMAALRRDYDRRFAHLVEEAQAAGEIRTDIHPDLATRLLFGAVNWLVEWYRPASSRFSPAVVRESILAMAETGLRGPSATPEPSGSAADASSQARRT